MKYFAVLFITAIITTALVSSNAVYNMKEVRQCDPMSRNQAGRLFDKCRRLASCNGSRNLGKYCDCCRNILGGNSPAADTNNVQHTCCVLLQDYYDKSLQCQNDPVVNVSDNIKNCNIRGENTSGGGGNTGGTLATTPISYFTGILLLLTAVAYQFLL